MKTNFLAISNKNSKTLSLSQIRWATEHDWFVKSNNDGTITVMERYSMNGQSFENEIIWDKSFNELREFAGY